MTEQSRRSWGRLSVVWAMVLACNLVLAAMTSLGYSRPAGATEPPLPEVGAQWHATWGSETDASRATELNTMQANGVQWVRIDVGWAMLQPRAGSYDTSWAVPFVERQIDAARARGFKVLVTFWRTPDWANGGKGPLVPPTDPATYANALAHFVKLWQGKVQAWEIWNEPNSSDFLAGADPVAYTSLLKSAYTAAHAADPAVNIVFGGTMYVDTAWITKVYDAGAKGYFDTMSVHPYMGRADAPPELPDTGDPYTMMHVDALVRLMQARGDGAMPIWFTEFGWSVHENTSTTPTWATGVTEAQQADYLKRSVALTANRWPQVDVMIWYNSRDKATGNAHQDGFGMMRRDFTVKPVLTMLKSIRDAATTVPPSPSPSATTSPAVTVSPVVTVSTPPTTSATSSPTATVTSSQSPTASPTKVKGGKGGGKPRR